MSDRTMIRLLGLGLLVFGILFVIELRAQRDYREDSAARLLAMHAQLEKLDGEITDMQVAIADLQKHSVKNVMGRANDAVVHGFSSLMGALRDELEQLSEMMEKEDAPIAPPESGTGDAD